jgi:hypothetical protein
VRIRFLSLMYHGQFASLAYNRLNVETSPSISVDLLKSLGAPQPRARQIYTSDEWRALCKPCEVHPLSYLGVCTVIRCVNREEWRSSPTRVHNQSRLAERTSYVKAPPGTYCYCREFGVLCAFCCGSSCLETSYYTAGQLRL